MLFTLFASLLLLPGLALASSTKAPRTAELRKYALRPSHELQNTVCETCANVKETAAMDSLVVRFAKYDTVFFDVIDNATRHDEHHIKVKLNF